MTIFEGRNQIAYSYGRFGYTRNSGKTWHGGIDVVGVDSSMIRAVVAGIVIFSGIVTNKTDRTWEWGYYVCIQGNDGRFYYYCHMAQAPVVRTGQSVNAGAAIGIMGNTGNAAGGYKHCHFEVRTARRASAAINPAPYCGCENRVGTYGPVSIKPLSSEACIINIGPASTGDVKMLQNLAASLQLGCTVADNVLSIGPMTPGDQVAVLTMADKLMLPAAQAIRRKIIAVTADSLRVRSGPGTDDFKQVDSVKAGQKFEVIDECDGWYFVETDGLDGWISAEYVRVVA